VQIKVDPEGVIWLQMKVDWHMEKMHLVEQLDAANRLLVEEKQCTTQLRKQSQRYVEEVTSVLADREVNANINAQNQQMVYPFSLHTSVYILQIVCDVSNL
jgi:hypothetical protein